MACTDGAVDQDFGPAALRLFDLVLSLDLSVFIVSVLLSSLAYICLMPVFFHPRVLVACSLYASIRFLNFPPPPPPFFPLFSFSASIGT